MKWSVRDESLHSKMGCHLFRHMCEENPKLLKNCEKDVLKAADTMLSAEEQYIAIIITLHWRLASTHIQIC